MSTLDAIMTDLGFAADVNSYLSGDRFLLTEFALGSSSRDITGAETSIENEVWRGPISRLAPTSILNQFVVEVVVPSSAGPFTVREGGVLDSAGRLIAIAKFNRFDKNPVVGNQIDEALLSLVVTVQHPENLVLKVDPTSVTASRNYVDDRVRDAAFIGHLALTAAMTNRMKIERKTLT